MQYIYLFQSQAPLAILHQIDMDQITEKDAIKVSQTSCSISSKTPV